MFTTDTSVLRGGGEGNLQIMSLATVPFNIEADGQFAGRVGSAYRAELVSQDCNAPSEHLAMRRNDASDHLP
jgi:hypothetical protein